MRPDFYFGPISTKTYGGYRSSRPSGKVSISSFIPADRNKIRFIGRNRYKATCCVCGEHLGVSEGYYIGFDPAARDNTDKGFLCCHEECYTPDNANWGFMVGSRNMKRGAAKAAAATAKTSTPVVPVKINVPQVWAAYPIDKDKIAPALVSFNRGQEAEYQALMDKLVTVSCMTTGASFLGIMLSCSMRRAKNLTYFTVQPLSQFIDEMTFQIPF
jgi:hypothetical protein